MSELKIIVGENILSTKVLIDDKVVSVIQNIKFEADANTMEMKLEISFPKVMEPYWSTRPEWAEHYKMVTSIKNAVIKFV